MDEHNEHDIRPGIYTHKEMAYTIVVLDVVTHTFDQKACSLIPLPEPTVLFRDVTAPVRNINGKYIRAHERTTVPISYFKLNFKSE